MNRTDWNGFLSLTGLGPQDLHARAGTTEVQLAVLNHFMANESDLLVFTSEVRITPETLVQAHRRLSEGQ